VKNQVSYSAIPLNRAERSSCGVGFVASLTGTPSHDIIQQALGALRCVEHRGACAADKRTGDGAGIMTDIPFDMLGYEPGAVAVATLFMPTDSQRKRLALKVFEETFSFMGLRVVGYRGVPTDPSVLGPDALSTLPSIEHAIIERPPHCRTDESFNRLLYSAKQATRTKERESGIIKEFFFTSLSTTTIVYKALTRAEDLDRFYLDLRNESFRSRFALIHRRFSTNTKTSWDKAQPFRLIGHNGEINTIAGNRTWAFAREHSLGLPADELLTHSGISDTGSLNEMVEALKYRSSIPRVEDILALMIPPADQKNSFYKFWSRAMEPWDGPAFITYSDGETIGARLDRNGFRPCRWTRTKDLFYLSSEAGSFRVDESQVLEKGTLHAGSGVTVDLARGVIDFADPSQSRENYDARFDPHLSQLHTSDLESVTRSATAVKPLNSSYNPEIDPFLFRYTDEDFERILVPMALSGKEAIGSMGDTARLAVLSEEPRSFFDFFYQDFAQVTNPPLDYLRESMVTDLTTYIGRRPNIFAPKELLPPARAIELASPILSSEHLEALCSGDGLGLRLNVRRFDCTFRRTYGEVGFRSQLDKIATEALKAVSEGVSVIVLSDAQADFDNPPIPTLLALRSVVSILNKNGLLLEASIIVESGEIRSAHDCAVLIGFGAAAVCPGLALALIQTSDEPELASVSTPTRSAHLLKALEGGLLKIMAKIGISVIRSYHGARLFTVIGLGREIMERFFPGVASPIGGITISRLVHTLLAETAAARARYEQKATLKTWQFKEHTRGTEGEVHSMTNRRSRAIHRIAREQGAQGAYEHYLEVSKAHEPVTIRHLFDLRLTGASISLDTIEPVTEILKRFGSGAMSFGAISAESQRDIIKAMKTIGGRSNSGEGGENPYYFIDGTTASVKQVASGRFGITAEYLINAQEFQIKIAQGAKPGEGGQLMGVKVNPDIARARHSNPNVDLISPPPLHDIYSIEDLKQLIYELKQFNPDARVSVKLVSGAAIGTIAIGVAKAGADIIHIAGHDGGTGAAPLTSMKHAGLPWEIGLAEVHRALVMNDLRDHVVLRADGALHTGRDLVIAAILGAEEFDFGKLLLVAQGCVMARICEKNTCPTGIATHDPKFKAKYRGTAEDIQYVLTAIAEDARGILARLGVQGLNDLIGQTHLLMIADACADTVHERGLDLGLFLQPTPVQTRSRGTLFSEPLGQLNSTVLADVRPALDDRSPVHLNYSISTQDRAVLAPLSALIAARVRDARLTHIAERGGATDTFHEQYTVAGPIDITFTGSAGQGFGAFLVEGINVRLFGEANDSVCKSISGGSVIISPHPDARYDPSVNAILGNCALYGATGGTLFAHGVVGDRFAVRNSGAIAVVEGAGLHACEYMTNGTIVILGSTSFNVGAGMTGGKLFLPWAGVSHLNTEYVEPLKLNSDDSDELRVILKEYVNSTNSERGQDLLARREALQDYFAVCVPIKIAQQRLNADEPVGLVA
jgi:glutamate synthase domain-containing protein 2/glutamate synthase domain-containing protein 1/glutamate synthase domain-containing protein 3